VGERNTIQGISTDYVFGPGIDEPLAKRTANGAVSYYGADALGSVVLVTDTNGTVTDSASYDPWGTRGGSSTELFGYTGRETAGPFWFNRARNYDPSTGRFMSEDPLRVGAAWALMNQPTSDVRFPPEYVYVYNSPALFRDPLGLDPCQNCVPCISRCIDTLYEDTFKCLRAYMVNKLACIAGFTACMAISKNVLNCSSGLALCEGVANTNVFLCRADASRAYQRCLHNCNCIPGR
jgi:RHS repeat-associated protein